MISLNGRESEWQDGLTVKGLLEIKKYTYARIVVIINGSMVQPEEYESTSIHDGDDVQVLHLMAGG